MNMIMCEWVEAYHQQRKERGLDAVVVERRGMCGQSMHAKGQREKCGLQRFDEDG